MVARGWGRRNGERLPIDTGSPSGVMKMFWNKIEVMVALNATELYTLKRKLAETGLA